MIAIIIVLAISVAMYSFKVGIVDYYKSAIR